MRLLLGVCATRRVNRPSAYGNMVNDCYCCKFTVEQVYTTLQSITSFVLFMQL